VWYLYHEAAVKKKGKEKPSGFQLLPNFGIPSTGSHTVFD
jgi:hypothetical protein